MNSNKLRLAVILLLTCSSNSLAAEEINEHRIYFPIYDSCVKLSVSLNAASDTVDAAARELRSAEAENSVSRPASALTLWVHLYDFQSLISIASNLELLTEEQSRIAAENIEEAWTTTRQTLLNSGRFEHPDNIEKLNAIGEELTEQCDVFQPAHFAN